MSAEPRPGDLEIENDHDAVGTVAETLEKSASGYTEVKVLTGKKATLENLRATVEDFRTREFTEIVDFMVYFAGPGASADGRHYIALSDSSDAGSMLALEELHSLVEGVNAQNRVVILDTGFVKGEGNRGLVLSGGAIAAFPDSLTKSKSVATISACGPDQGGHEAEELGNGVFTSQLAEALAGPADINTDKIISAEEAVTFLEWPIERYVRDNTVGQSQKPALVCDKKVAGATLVKIK